MDIQEIKNKFEELKNHDSELGRYSIGRLRYESYPIPEKEVSSFESKYGISLPSIYRRFLIEIGHGTGPHYGIWNLEETEAELDTIKDIKQEVNIEISPAMSFPFREKDIKELNKKIESHLAKYNTLPALEAIYPSNGCVPICTHGCTFWSCLVVTGDLTGTVWDVANPVGYDGWWTPAGFSVDENKYYSVTFEKWIKEWLEKEHPLKENSISGFRNDIFDFITRIFK